MQVNFTGHQIEVTEPLRNYTEEKIERLHRRFDRIGNINIIFDVQKLRQIAKATIHVPGSEIVATAEDEDMYAAIDFLFDKLDRQIVEYKERIKNHRD